MMDKEIIHKELDLIQAIVTRMAANSFQVKAWMIGILSALVVVESKSLFVQADFDTLFSIEMNLFLLIPVFCFWYLDAFFLSTERLYRELYKWVVNNRLNTNKYLYDLNTFQREYVDSEGQTHTTNMIKSKNNIWNVMVSKTLVPFYLTPVLFVIGLLFYNLFRQ